MGYSLFVGYSCQLQTRCVHWSWDHTGQSKKKKKKKHTHTHSHTVFTVMCSYKRIAFQSLWGGVVRFLQNLHPNYNAITAKKTKKKLENLGAQTLDTFLSQSFNEEQINISEHFWSVIRGHYTGNLQPCSQDTGSSLTWKIIGNAIEICVHLFSCCTI